jgi:hypothetical protein
LKVEYVRNEPSRSSKKRAADVNNKAIKVIQVWLKLGSPWVGAAVDALREQGYFLGGLLPRWFDDDGFLMQKLLCPPDWEGIRLHTDRAKILLNMAHEDWDRVTGGHL